MRIRNIQKVGKGGLQIELRNPRSRYVYDHSLPSAGIPCINFCESSAEKCMLKSHDYACIQST